MLHNLSTVFIIFIILVNNLPASTHQFKGRVIDIYSGEGIPGVELFGSTQGTTTDGDGSYRLALEIPDSLTIRCIGYETLKYSTADLTPIVQLKPKILQGQSIHVSSNRVIPGITSVAYSRLSKGEIRERYTVEDVPMILSSEAGVFAYSESGNGTGYSYVSIRGFDQSSISVMLDNVPLNDNESHQVYWVDHGDILSDANDVEIQRGLGSSLYGASSFGGSININTGIKSDSEALSFQVLAGSYNTRKFRMAYKSGLRLGHNLSFSVRGSMLDSDGYRVDSRSEQRSLVFGLEHRGVGITNQFRATLGKEYSVLQWDGVSQTYLDDPDLRRKKMPWTTPFTDDYFQQIYSLNTQYYFSNHSAIHNVLYLVRGDGYYEDQRYDQDYFSYNLDIMDVYPDSIEQALGTDFLRRKWINNAYYGITPVWTYEAKKWRSDLGMELRQYTGDHFGEVYNVSNPDLSAILSNPYEYYAYVGTKRLASVFAQLVYRVTPKISTNLGVRTQGIWWQLDQEQIGHAPGVDLSANWKFINPRFGLRYEMSKELSLFAAIGSAQKEPADDQIIEADDVWSMPVSAPTEAVKNTELGLIWSGVRHMLALNLYQIDYQNELLSDIYDFQDGSFQSETATLTTHRGMEFETKSRFMNKLSVNINGSIAEHTFAAGPLTGNTLTNVPGILANAHFSYHSSENLFGSLSLKYVGQQYIDFQNSDDLAIPAYFLADFSLHLTVSRVGIQMRINNILDAKYATFGYSYDGGYYWPGATRNYMLSLIYSL